MFLGVIILNVYMHEKNAIVGVIIIRCRYTYTVGRAVVREIVVISVKSTVIVCGSVSGSDSNRGKAVDNKVLIIRLCRRGSDLISARYNK